MKSHRRCIVCGIQEVALRACLGGFICDECDGKFSRNRIGPEFGELMAAVTHDRPAPMEAVAKVERRKAKAAKRKK